jgi:hypothetical protein
MPRASSQLAVLTIVRGFVLLSGMRGAALAQPSTDVIQDLDRAVAPSSDAPCPDPSLYATARPDPPGEPTVVGLGVFFQDLTALNDADQTLDVDAYLIARWRDARLAAASRGTSSAECPVPAGQLWMPQLEPERLRSRQTFYPDRFLVDARGVVTLVRRLFAKVAYPLDFRDFPFDRHELDDDAVPAPTDSSSGAPCSCSSASRRPWQAWRLLRGRKPTTSSVLIAGDARSIRWRCWRTRPLRS